MLAVTAAAFLGWSMPTDRMMGRRDALIAGLGASAVFAVSPAPAFAQRSSLIPRSSKESTENFKAYQLSKPSDETDAFKAAEAKRKQLQNGGVGVAAKEETPEETMRRLGITTYSDAIASGKPDACAPGASFACGRPR